MPILPSKEILDYQYKNIKAFTDVVIACNTADTPIRKRNGNAVIAHQLSLHPHIHRGYYDALIEDCLYVKDCFTGELIHKSNAVLLNTGEFTENSSERLFDYTSRSFRQDFFNRQYSKYINKAALNPNTSLYEKFDPQVFELTVNFRTVQTLLQRYFIAECNEHGVMTLPYHNETHLYPQIIHELLRNVTHSILGESRVILKKNNSFLGTNRLIPEDSIFLPNMRVLDCTYSYINLNHQQPIVYSSLNPNYELFHIDKVPFDFLIINQAFLNTSATENSRTNNNDGRLLEYSAKVDRLKKSFLMTEKEKAYFAKMKPTEEKPIYLGIEIEAQTKHPFRDEKGFKKVIKDISDSTFGNHVIFKSDSSTGSYGLEMVSIPATLKYHKDIFKDHLFTKENAISQKLIVTDQCGIHVHISKNAFTPLTLGKFTAFINAKGNAAFINAMANRPPNGYCQRLPLKGINKHGVDQSVSTVRQSCVNSSIKQGLLFQQNSRADRRTAVNHQNANTIEVRIFKSSIDKNNILRKLEFCESLVKFVRVHSIQEMTVDKYIAFLLRKENATVYTHLIRWLAAYSYISHERKVVKYLDKSNSTYKAKLVHIFAPLNSTKKVKNPCV